MAEPADHAIRRAKMNAPWDGHPEVPEDEVVAELFLPLK